MQQSFYFSDGGIFGRP